MMPNITIIIIIIIDPRNPSISRERLFKKQIPFDKLQSGKTSTDPIRAVRERGIK